MVSVLPAKQSFTAQSDMPAVRSADNLAFTYQEALTSIVRLRSARQVVSDAHHFRSQFIEALKLAQGQARARGYSDDEIRDARFAVVAFLDETILNLRTAVFTDWVRKPLQEELFGTHIAGEVFFQNLDRMARQPDSKHLADGLEVYLLCLSLGYAGKYSASGRGELMGFKQELISRIRRIHGPEAELSPSWRPGTVGLESSSVDAGNRPLLYAALVCSLLVLALFAVYKYSLQSSAALMTTSETAGGVR